MRRYSLIAALLIVAGCAPQTPQRAWTATRPETVALEHARARCEKEAVAHAGSAPRHAQGLAASAAGGVFIECMRKAGWELKPVAE